MTTGLSQGDRWSEEAAGRFQDIYLALSNIVKACEASVHRRISAYLVRQMTAIHQSRLRSPCNIFFFSDWTCSSNVLAWRTILSQLREAMPCSGPSGRRSWDNRQRDHSAAECAGRPPPTLFRQSHCRQVCTRHVSHSSCHGKWRQPVGQPTLEGLSRRHTAADPDYHADRLMYMVGFA